MLEKILKKSLVVGAFLMEFANCGRENIVYYTSENDVKQEDITEKKDTAEETGNSRNKDSYHNTLDDGYSTETQEENKIEISENDAYDSTDSLGTYLSPETCEEKSFFEDKDRDGYGRKEVQLWVCQKPEGYSEFFTDCDDGNPLINPEAVESCDESDNNCNNLIDENLVQTCYTICEEGLETCIEGTWKNCTASLPELEICDYVDNDCNGLIDEKFEVGKICYVGEGECKSQGTVECIADGFDTYCTTVLKESKQEICDYLDNDCDGETDEGLKNVYYEDKDYDGFGNPALKIEACSLSFGYSFNYYDCDDTSSQIKPGAKELCNGIDDDCDQKIDEGFNTGEPCSDKIGECTYYGVRECFTENTTHCNFTSEGQGKNEVCDGKDNDCDGETDENLEQIVPCGYNNKGEQKQICKDGSWENLEDCIETNNCPVLSPIGTKEVKEGEKLEFIVSATDADNDSLTFGIPSDSIYPDGSSFSPTGLFSWTPTCDQSGEYQLNVMVSDGKCFNNEKIIITVKNNPLCGKECLDGTIEKIECETNTPCKGHQERKCVGEKWIYGKCKEFKNIADNAGWFFSVWGNKVAYVGGPDPSNNGNVFLYDIDDSSTETLISTGDKLPVIRLRINNNLVGVGTCIKSFIFNLNNKSGCIGDSDSISDYKCYIDDYEYDSCTEAFNGFVDIQDGKGLYVNKQSDFSDCMKVYDLSTKEKIVDYCILDYLTTPADAPKLLDGGIVFAHTNTFYGNSPNPYTKLEVLNTTNQTMSIISEDSAECIFYNFLSNEKTVIFNMLYGTSPEGYACSASSKGEWSIYQWNMDTQSTNDLTSKFGIGCYVTSSYGNLLTCYDPWYMYIMNTRTGDVGIISEGEGEAAMYKGYIILKVGFSNNLSLCELKDEWLN
ncbi:hypothetical protein J4417_01635 [Candidatus Woesearchaeota archaeon]|nr:hypothetical protein [Candidatus Woesearchaeota archaeon]